MYLCGEVECSEGMRMVPLVCRENWEEFLQCLHDDGSVARLEVKKLAMIKSDPVGMFVSTAPCVTV